MGPPDAHVKAAWGSGKAWRFLSSMQIFVKNMRVFRSELLTIKG